MARTDRQAPVEPSTAEQERPPSARASQGGRAGAGGYDFQARTTAFILAHALSAESLNWTENEGGDCPLAVSSETGGAGDDICVELAEGREYQVQVKRTLSAGEELRAVAERFAGGLSSDPAMVAILVVSPAASRVIREHLREDLKRIAQGRLDHLRAVSAQFLAWIGGSERAARVRVVVLDLESNEGGHRRLAILLLEKIVRRDANARSAWDVLCAASHRLAAEAGRRDLESVVTLLRTAGISLQTELPSKIERSLGMYSRPASRLARIETSIAAAKGYLAGIDFINIPRVIELALDAFGEVPKTAMTEQLEDAGRIDRTGQPTDRLFSGIGPYPLEGAFHNGVLRHFSEILRSLVDRLVFEDLEWLIRSKGRYLSDGLIGKRCFYVGTLVGKSPPFPITLSTPPTKIGFRKRGVIAEWLIDPRFLFSNTAVARLGDHEPYLAYGIVRAINTRRVGSRTFQAIDLRPLALGLPTRIQHIRPHTAALRRDAQDDEVEKLVAEEDECFAADAGDDSATE